MVALLKRSIPDRELLPDLRALLCIRPYLADYPEILAALLKTEEHEIWMLLDVLRIEGEVLA
jgi:hypothetical protein